MQEENQIEGMKTTRRQFTGLVCGSGLLTLFGCGGGDSATGAAPTGAPQITASPQSASVVAGQSVTLEVQAAGEGLAYQWRRNGVALAGATENRLVVAASVADSGAQYSVLVSNALGQVESAPALLSVTQGAGISLLAGRLGGFGYLEGNGAQARIPSARDMAVGKDGTIFFWAREDKWYPHKYLCWISPSGEVRFIDNTANYWAPHCDFAVDSQGACYMIAGTSLVYKFINGALAPFAIQAARQFYCDSPVFDAQDNLYFIDTGFPCIVRVTPAGETSILAGGEGNRTLRDGKGADAGFAKPSKLLALNDGSLLVVDGTSWRRVTTDGVVTTLTGTAATLNYDPHFHFLPLAGVDVNALYTVSGHGIVRIALDGTTIPVAGSPSEAGYLDGVGTAARFNQPGHLAMGPEGKLIVADRGNAMIRRIDPATGQVSALAGAAPQPGRVDGTWEQARFADMGPSCVDATGSLYVMDTVAKTLRRTTPAGVVTTLFSDFPCEGGLAVDASGNFYGVRDRAIVRVTPSGNQQVWAGQSGVLGYADGPGSSASFARPQGLAFDAQGNLYVGDASEIHTYAIGMGYEKHVVYTYGTTIRKITPAGVVSTIVGVPGQVLDNARGYEEPFADFDATFVSPTHLAFDASGNLWVLDFSETYLDLVDAPEPRGVRVINLQGGTSPTWVSRDTSLTALTYVGGSAGGVFVTRRNYDNYRANAAYGQGPDYYLGRNDATSLNRLGSDGSLTRVAGEDIAYHDGVRLGSPGYLGVVTSLAAGGENLLYACCENSVLRIQLG